MRYLIVITAVILSGCSAFGPLERERTDGMAGYSSSEAFKVGFLHGCRSGYRSAGNPYNPYTKDRNRHGSDSEYTKGWDEAYDRCYKQYSSIPDVRL
ncbi:MAG: hypothetical protein O3C55_11460 [Proteobacteria bacterium]|nr:hypothetical protein [Pseudomonadota bacterium]|tara:strand:- start:421 stop:711 length:291 start_codon:yes stop_codon:yes gene_type:complete